MLDSREQLTSVQDASQHQAHLEPQPPLQPTAAIEEPKLAADPWAQDVRVPTGYNPWSIGLGGLQPHQEPPSSAITLVGREHARGTELQTEGPRASHVVSQLNPAAGEYLGSGPVLPSPAADLPSSRAPAASSNIWGAQGLFGPPAASHASQASQWAASSGMQLPSRPASDCSQWMAMQPPMQASSGPLDWGQGASPPFADAPLFLSSMMQQVRASRHCLVLAFSVMAELVYGLCCWEQIRLSGDKATGTDHG